MAISFVIARLWFMHGMADIVVTRIQVVGVYVCERFAPPTGFGVLFFGNVFVVCVGTLRNIASPGGCNSLVGTMHVCGLGTVRDYHPTIFIIASHNQASGSNRFSIASTALLLFI